MLQVDPAAAVYIADNPLKDFYGPRQLGMGTIWYQRLDGEYSAFSPPSPDYAADVIVSSSDELNHLLIATEQE